MYPPPPPRHRTIIPYTLPTSPCPPPCKHAQKYELPLALSAPTTRRGARRGLRGARTCAARRGRRSLPSPDREVGCPRAARRLAREPPCLGGHGEFNHGPRVVDRETRAHRKVEEIFAERGDLTGLLHGGQRRVRAVAVPRSRGGGVGGREKAGGCEEESRGSLDM